MNLIYLMKMMIDLKIQQKGRDIRRIPKHEDKLLNLTLYVPFIEYKQ
jgi:hypothetical protein